MVYQENNQNQQKEKLLYDSHETASMLSIGVRSLQRLTSEGLIRSVKVGRRSIRYCRSDIEDFIKQNTSQGN